MNLRPATERQRQDAQLALEHLRIARTLLVVADSPKTLARVRAAIRSAEGAVRHISRRAQG